MRSQRESPRRQLLPPPPPPSLLLQSSGPAKETNPLFEARKKTFGVGGAPPPRSSKRDLHRWVKWPKYVRLQRQRRVLNQRMKVKELGREREGLRWWELRAGTRS